MLVAAEASEIAKAVTAEFSQALPHRKAVRKALACDFSPVLPTHKAFYLFDFTSSLLTNIKNYRFYTPRPTPRPLFILQKIPSVVTQLPLIKPRLLLVFYTSSPTTEDTFRPCLAFTRSCSATCLRRSLPTQPYNGPLTSGASLPRNAPSLTSEGTPVSVRPHCELNTLECLTVV